MKHPELRQQGENEEAYIRRIAKFPTLCFDTLVYSLFWSRNINSHSIISLIDWIKKGFPKSNWISYANWDSHLKSNPDYIDHVLKCGSASIPTKEFAKWMAEQNIVEAWRCLGEKPTPNLELFIELVSAKAGIEKKTTKKTKANRGRWKAAHEHREAARKLAKALWDKDDSLTIADMTRYDEINKAAPNYAERTLRDWLKDLAPSNKPGCRRKKK